jgi:hypothetical protein
MVETKYHIQLHVKTGNDFQCYGKFFLGKNRKLANDIFQKLKGSKKVTDKTILHLDLVEARNELPTNIQMISCSLDELAENCKIITKEIFKFSNLEQV